MIFRYVLCMGNENYLSLRRLKRSAQAGLFTHPDEENQWEGIFNWAGETETGFRSDLPFEVLPQVWERSRTTERSVSGEKLRNSFVLLLF